MPILPGSPPVVPWNLLYFGERQRFYEYGRRQGLTEAQTQESYSAGQRIGTTRYQQGVVSGVRSGRRRIESPGLLSRSDASQRRIMREAHRYDPNASPQDVDRWIREGLFRPYAREQGGRIPVQLVRPDSNYTGNVNRDRVTGYPVGNNLDDPMTAQNRIDAVQSARNFASAMRAEGREINEDKVVERIYGMTPEQLERYRNQTDEQRRAWAYAPGDDDGTGRIANPWWYH